MNELTASLLEYNNIKLSLKGTQTSYNGLSALLSL